MPIFFRMFIGLAVDLKLVRQRKNYIVVAAMGIAISFGVASWAKTASAFCICLTVAEVFIQIFESANTSLSIEQARIDLNHG